MSIHGIFGNKLLVTLISFIDYDIVIVIKYLKLIIFGLYHVMSSLYGSNTVNERIQINDSEEISENSPLLV